MAVGVAETLEASVSQAMKLFEELKNVSHEITDLDRKLRDVSSDLERERVAARHMQAEIEVIKTRNEALKQAIDDSSFVLVLIDADADGYIFKDEYYTDPDGGRKAAADLEAVVREYMKRSHPALERLPIMIRAFANLDGLSHLLTKAKLIKSPMALSTFAKSFSQASHMSDFVFVGSGKDRADEKIKGVFEQFIGNPTCRHVMFGACHDNGYVRLLERYRHNAGAHSHKVTLVYPFEPGKEFAGLSELPSVKFETIFQSEPVSTRNSPPQVHRPLSAEVDQSRRSPSGGTPWVTVPSTLPQHAVSRRHESLPRGSIYVNAAGQRVDSVLDSPSQEAQGTWNRKMGAKMRFCRKYHLHPNGCGGGCGYSHGPLTEDERLVYRHRLRLETCHTGPPCRDPGCFYGHHCPCVGKNCKFSPEMHQVDVSSIRVITCV